MQLISTPTTADFYRRLCTWLLYSHSYTYGSIIVESFNQNIVLLWRWGARGTCQGEKYIGLHSAFCNLGLRVCTHKFTGIRTDQNVAVEFVWKWKLSLNFEKKGPNLRDLEYFSFLLIGWNIFLWVDIDFPVEKLKRSCTQELQCYLLLNA